MTILQAILKKDIAYVGADTGVMDNGGPGAAARGARTKSKLHPLVHLSAVLTGSGPTVLHEAVYAHCRDFSGTFDDLLAEFESIVMKSDHEAATWARKVGWPDYAGMRISSIIVGWSEKQDRVAGLMYWQPDPNSHFVRWDLADRTMAQPSDVGLPLPRTVDEMAAFARLQSEYVRRTKAAHWAPGRLIIAEITRDGMTIRTAGELA